MSFSNSAKCLFLVARPYHRGTSISLNGFSVFSKTRLCSAKERRKDERGRMMANHRCGNTNVERRKAEGGRRNVDNGPDRYDNCQHEYTNFSAKFQPRGNILLEHNLRGEPGVPGVPRIPRNSGNRVRLVADSRKLCSRPGKPRKNDITRLCYHVCESQDDWRRILGNPGKLPLGTTDEGGGLTTEGTETHGKWKTDG
jgi:hypothetical protein